MININTHYANDISLFIFMEGLCMKKILLLATGGTIASVEGNEGLVPGLSAEELLNYFFEVFSKLRNRLQNLNEY